MYLLLNLLSIHMSKAIEGTCRNLDATLLNCHTPVRRIFTRAHSTFIEHFDLPPSSKLCSSSCTQAVLIGSSPVTDSTSHVSPENSSLHYLIRTTSPRLASPPPTRTRIMILSRHASTTTATAPATDRSSKGPLRQGNKMR